MSLLVQMATKLAGTQLFVAPRRVAVAGRRALTTKVAASKNFTKTDLINKVAEEAEISNKHATKAVNTLLETIVQTVAKGEKVVIPGFGTFEQRVRAARRGRNPRTGEELAIPESKAPAFSAGKTFKDTVKGGPK